ncbi:MAG TPA: hypothetical protein VK595_04315 [Vicinamibacterales bacterium]|jgi:hypothetical protein|nr:hypothetical protein [Vicinamibacterales bacterium]
MDRLARISQMVAHYGEVKHRRLLRIALKLWRRTEAHELIEKCESRPERIH